MKTCLSLAAIAALTSVCAFAQEEAAAEEESKPVQTEAKKTSSEKLFMALPFCHSMSGVAEVRKPGSEAWEALESGHFYPLGSSYRTGEDGQLVVAFGKDVLVKLEKNTSFGTRQQGLSVQSRTIVLESGVLVVTLPENAPDGAFVVTAKGFLVKNPAGESKYVFADKGDGYEATVRCVTGTMSVEGRHFAIPKMTAANEFRIRQSHDELETILYGLSGDYTVNLDQGIAATLEIGDDGQKSEKVAPQTLAWRLSPETRVQINRAVPAIGEKMSVHTMAFDAAGTMQSERSFCEQRAEVNSGEMVPKAAAADDEKKAKAARETEATEEAVTDEDSSDDAKKASNEGNENNEKESEQE